MTDTKELIDECFYVEETKYKVWHSIHVDGRKLISSSTKDACINATRFYLKGLQEGFVS